MTSEADASDQRDMWVVSCFCRKAGGWFREGSAQPLPPSDRPTDGLARTRLGCTLRPCQSSDWPASALISPRVQQKRSFSPFVSAKIPVRLGRLAIVSIRHSDPALDQGPECPTVPCSTERHRVSRVDTPVGGFEPLPVISGPLRWIKR